MTQTSKVELFCDRVIEAGWLAAVVVVPIFFNVYSSRVFEPDKISLLRSLAVLMAVAWLIKFIERGFRLHRDGEEGATWWQSIRDVPLALPTLALVGVYLLSTALSVVPRTSLLGSYQRQQGTYSMLSYILVFLMMLQGIRSRKQVERFVTTVILTSVPITLYGILQNRGLDPLPWGGDVQSRVAANMGNAIFIAAYLIMALPLTLYRLVESFIAILSSEKEHLVDVLLGSGYFLILALQGICIFYSQSRGPWLGLVLGLVFFALVLAVIRRWRWLVWTVVALAVLGVVFLVVLNLPESPLEPLRSVPYIGRLGRVLDKEEATSKVRLLIWQGAIEMIVPHPPLEKPDGSPDALNWARPLIGYGPESMYVAYNRFYPPELAHIEKRNASPDRSHNETFDSLVTTGLLGFAVYMWLFASAFSYGFQRLGVIAGRKQRNLFLGCWFGGGVAGALVLGFWQGPEFVGVGLPAGIALGLWVYLVVWGLFLSRRADKPARSEQAAGGAPPASDLTMLMVALVSAAIAHFVEIHFGIAIAATRLYFWAYLGLLVVVGQRLRHASPEEPVLAGGAPRSPSRGGSGKVRRSRRQAEAASEPSGLLAVLPDALIVALILSTVAFGFVSNKDRLEMPGEILWSALAQRVQEGALVPSFGALMVVSWLLCSAVMVGEWRRGQVRAVAGGERETRRGGSRGRSGSGGGRRARRAAAMSWLGPLGLCLGVSLLVWVVFSLVLAGRWSAMVQQKLLLDLARVTLGMLSSYYWLGLLLVLALAAALAIEQRVAQPRAFPERFTGAKGVYWIAYAALLAACVLISIYTNLRPIHADMAYKQSDPYEQDGMWDFVIVLDQEAIKLAPTEDFYYLFLGRAFLEKAKTAPVSERPGRRFTLPEALRLSTQQLESLTREDLFELSETVLLQAQQINPLNTDHSANLGRLYRTRAELTSDPAKKEAYLARSLEYFAQATSLSPNAAHLFDEWGLVYFVMGDYQAAIEKYEHSLAIDDRYLNTYLSLGDAYMAAGQPERAEAVYVQAIAIEPNLPDVYSMLSYLYSTQGRLDEAISATLKVLSLPGNENLLYGSYKNLAILYRDQGRLEEALAAAQSALVYAPEADLASAEQLVALLAGGGEVPETMALVQRYLAEGEVALNGENWARADTAYNQALALEPDLVAAHSALAYVYAQQGRLQEAVQENLIVLDTVPDDYATLKNLAILYQQLGRPSDALNYALQALQSPGADPDERPQLEIFIQSLQG